MNKFKSIIKHFTNIVVWTMVTLYILVAIILHIPLVQQTMGKTVAKAMADKIGSKVTVGNIDLGMLNRIIIDDVVILDQNGKEMLKAARIAAKIDIIDLLEGKVNITSAQLFTPQLSLYKTAENEKTNFQFVLDSLASKDTTQGKPINLEVASFIMRHGSLAYDQYDKARTSGKLNIYHIDLKNINIYASLDALTPDSIIANVREFSLEEKSGLKIKDISFALNANKQKTTLTDFSLELPKSRLCIPKLSATYKHNGKHIIPATLKFNGTVENSTITPADLAFLQPKLNTFKSHINLYAQFSGNSTSLTMKRLNVKSDNGDINLDAKGWIKENGKRKLWYADISKLELAPEISVFISENIEGKTVEVPEMLKKCGNIHIVATAASTNSGGITAKGKVRTNVGEMILRIAIDNNKQFNSHIYTQGINLQRLIGDKRLGEVAVDVNLNGKLKPGITASCKGEVSRFSYEGYNFSNINLDAHYSSQTIAGNIAVDDPNIKFEAEGEMTKKGKKKLYSLNVIIDDICPKAIHITDKWGDARFTTSLNADIVASDINDSKGSLNISNFCMTSAEDTCVINNIEILTGYNHNRHNILFNSDFGNIELNGEFNYGTLLKSMANIIGEKLPTLPGLKHDNRTFGNSFELSANIRSTKWLKPLLGVNLDIETPLAINAKMDDKSKLISLSVDIDRFTFNDKLYGNTHFYLDTPLDTLKLKAKITKEMNNGDLMDLKADCSAADNKLSTSIKWDNGNSAKRLLGELNSIATFFTNENGEKAASIEIIPSHINIGDKQWEVAASKIDYRKNFIDVEQFKIEHGQQHILINGTASDNTNDSLSIDLKAVDVDYVLNLVNFHSVSFSGEASGRAYVVAPFGKFDAHAKLNVDKFLFEDGRMGVLDAYVNWNREEKQIDIHATANDGPDAKTHINGYVSPARNYIDLDLRADGTHIDFLHSFTNSFISEVTGQARGRLNLVGPLDNINLVGQMTVDGEAHIRPLNTRYFLKNQTVTLIPDEIKLDGVTIADAYGNLGHISGSLFHKHLTRLSYDLNIKAENLLAYDFRDFGDNTFYGTVFGTGNVAIKGRSGLFVMDVDVTPQPNSSFTYNVSSPDALSSQGFIEWDMKDESLEGKGFLEGRGKKVEGSENTLQSSINLSSDMYLNFSINCTPDATIRLLMDANTNDYITLNGNGVIRATYYDKGAFNMYGTYTVDHGTYGITIQNILKKNFTFNQGSTLVFGGNPFDAQLNLQAVHTVNGVSLADLNVGNSFSNNTIRVNCLMNIGGIARAPQVNFDIDMPTVSTDEKQIVRNIINSEEEMNQQVVYLLGIGKFYPQTNNNSRTQGSGQYSQTSLAMQSLLSGTISGQINSILGSVIKSDNWNFGANISTGDEGWNNAEYEGLLSGRLLNNRLLINGQFGYRDNAATANTSFIGDFDIRYLLTPNGNIALKVYNQTNDRYFTKSSLNTQGVGLIMKKDFTNLRDLFGKKRKKKGSRKEE